MSLSLIVGPPNSGKAGEILIGLRRAMDRDPTLVVPTLDDADRFERELCAAGGEASGVLGVSIQTFQRLFEDVARATGVALAPAVTDAQHLHLVRAASRQTRLGVLARSAKRPGFAPALANLISEAQASGLGPAALAANAEATDPGGGYLREVAALYAAYADARDALGYGDEHVAAAQATTALRAQPDTWGRPVFVYGFDDLTVEQLDLLGVLAQGTEVSVAVTYEDRRALTARARLHQDLLERGGARASVELAPERRHTESATLFHLERSFLEDGAERLEPDDGLAFMEAAGERGQAEQIGGEIARLLADGVAPDEIAVVVRTPNRYGPLYESVFASFGIPVAVEAKIPLTGTGSGRGLVALLRAALISQRAEDVLAFVRTPGVASPGDADWLERDVRRGGLRTAADALEAWRGRDLFELEQLAKGSGPASLFGDLARFAQRIAERPHEREAPLAARQHRLELRAGALASEALESLVALPSVEDPARDALGVLEAIEVPLWQGPTDGRVRVTSPYRIRASRVPYLFVASLQEGEFPRHDAGEPFLSDEQRAGLGLTARADPDDEERYLFHVCLSSPTRRLYLCWRDTDDEGGESPPSPFLEDVADLLADPGEAGGGAGGAKVARRLLGDVTFEPDAAPSIDELARSLAAAGQRPDSAALREALGVGEDVAAEVDRRLARAAGRQERRFPGPLSLPLVLAELGERQLFGASTLEEYSLCSYRWFVQHELRPQATDPEPEARAQGSVIHAVLESLYRNPPADGPAPTTETLDAWRRRAAELVAELADVNGLGGDDAAAVTSRARMVALIDRFLEREAASDSQLVPDSELLEASFGEEEGADRPPLPLDGFSLHGKIDRVDVPATGEPLGLIRDYKVSRTVTSGAKLAEEGKLQPQLYALALQELWRRRALGGLYQPLAATQDHRPRGIALLEESDRLLAGLELVGTDMLEDKLFSDALEAARKRAGEVVADMRAGRITRNPIDDSCPPFCTFQAICRRERSVRQEPDILDEDDGEDS